MDRRATRAELCDRLDKQRRLTGVGSGGGQAGQGGLCVQWAQGHPLPLDALPSRDVVALAPGGEQGRGVRPRRQPPLCGDGSGAAPHQGGTWSRSRRVGSKVEVSDQGVNPRFVVTDLEQARTKVLYQKIYCARGQAENEIKDHKVYLKSDRTSCHRFAANQLRVFLHAAAYVLLETLRREVFRTTQWAAATMETLQLRLLKLGARVQECEERITISLP